MIHFDQPELWTPEAQRTVLLAAQIVEARLGAPFGEVFGKVKTWFVPTLKTHAEANWGNIKFQSNEVITLPLVVHEMGHLFSVRAKNRPTKQLWLDRNKLDTIAASLWPGMHPPYLKGYNIVEKFCDAWEIEMLQLHAQDVNGITDAGERLHAWMAAHLPEWVAIAREG